MWFAQHVDPSVPANIAQYVELRGDLDRDLLQRVSSEAAMEMQSGFVRIVEVDSEPHQFVDPTLEDPLGYVDLRNESDPDRAAQEWMRADYSAPIDILRDRLIAATVLHLEDDRYFWFNRVHHVVLDGFGAVTFMNRTAELYTAAVQGTEPSANKSSDLRKVYEIDLAYRDSTRFESDRKYWAERIAGIEEATSLTGRSAAPAPVSQIDTVALGENTVAQLDGLISSTESTLATVVVAAFASYMAQMTGKEDVVLSLPVTARTTAVLRRSGGMVSNVVPLRLAIASDTTVQQLLTEVTTAVSGALRHQRYRHEDIRRDAGGASGQASFFGPWVNIMLFFGEVRLGDMVGGINILSTGLIEDFGLNLYQSVAGSTTHIDFESNPNLYSSEESARNHARFVEFLDRFVAAPPSARVWDLELVTAAEQKSVLTLWNETDHEIAPRTLLSDFHARVDADPDATALIYERTTLSYGELGARVSAVARLLIEQGVGPETLVGLSIRRSLDLVVAMYGIVEAGGAWVPIDPDHPAERTGYILESAQPLCVLTVARDGIELPAGTEVIEIDRLDYESMDSARVEDSDRAGPLRLDNTAYVIYTSGSTGRPKGVAVSHAAIDNQLQWMRTEYALDASDVYLQKTATTFDVSLWGFFLPLQVGASMVLATPDGHRDSIYVADKIAEHAVTVTDFVPSMLTVFVSNAPVGTCSSLRHVFVIGEALPAETAAAFRELTDAGLHNLYGPTEAAVSVTYYRSGPQDTRTVPIGVPEWNTKTYVLDSRLRPSPIGEAGELYLSGVQLARGYVGRPDLSADRFVADPFSSFGDRMYRTGDLVRWRADGTIDYIGRTDFQVKFRGQRIELGEIETVLLAHEAISQAVALVVPTATGEQLVAYVVPGPGATATAAEAIEFAGRSLPSYMVPASVMVLEALPLNTSGKLDRKALPEPVFTSAKTYRAPQSHAEYVVAGVFEDVLGADRVGLDEDFFELGGNSLIATQLVTRVGTALGIRLGVRELFEAPTVGALAARAETALEQGSSSPELVAGKRPDVLPLSLAQQRMWFLNRFDPETAAYNLPFMVRLTGKVDARALSQAFGDVVARHETLRTIYPQVDESPQQIILRTEDVFSELQATSVDEAALMPALVELAQGGFDVSSEAPFRIELFRLTETDHVLAMVLHHIAADGSSFGPLARDIMVAYAARANGDAPGWEPLDIQYADYALWQRRVLGQESDEASLSAQQIGYWLRTLDELPDQLDLPSDRPRPAVATNGGAKSRFVIDARIHKGLSEVARSHQASLFMVVQAAYAALLSRLSGTTDIAMGAPIAGRAHEQLDDIIGMFVNTLVLRARVEPQHSFDELLDQVRNTNLSAFAHADIPFERLVEVLNPARSSARHPLFQVALSLERARERELNFAGLRASAEELDVPIAKFDLQLWLTENHDESGRPAQIDATFEYATDLFDAATIEGFADRFLRILDAIVTDSSVPVGAIDILAPDEADRLTSVHGGVVQSQRLLPEFLAAGVSTNPGGVAVRTADGELSYRELDAITDRLARYLVDRGIGPEKVVALAFPRSMEMVVSIWAVAKSGAAWVPVDPEYPVDRVRHILSDSGAVVGITSSARIEELPGTCDWWAIDDAALGKAVESYPAETVSDADRTTPLRLDHPAYVIYTSGSTGLPKGVSVTHRGLSGLVDQSRELYRVTPQSRFLHVISPSFDPSVLEWALTASAGATLVVAPPSIIGGPELRTLFADAGVTHAIITPAVLGSMDPAGLDDLELLSVGGEASAPDLVSRWARGRRFFNAYGPTETTIVSTRAELFVGEPITVGSPVPGVGALILDSRLQPVPTGVAGELYLSGEAVARGYYQREKLTAERFVADPYGPAGSRMYRTGDVVRWTKDFAIEYVGRSDFQVKVRGFRIELGEIDAALETFPAVTFAATLGHTMASGQTALVSYVHGSVGIDSDELTKYVARILPSYMVPSSVIVLDEVPLTPIGKLDRRALPEPELGISFRQFRAPTTPIEETVANVFGDVLGAPVVGLDDDFFELGGNSLIATQVVARLGAALDAQVPVRAIFESPTVAQLAIRVEQEAGRGARIALSRSVRPERIPLSLAQQRMWFLNRFDTESATYNLPIALRLSGVLDVPALQVAIMDVIDRHESLRTVFPDSAEGPHQVIQDAAQIVPNLMPVETTARDLQRAIAQIASGGFDVTADVPVRAQLFEIAPTEHVLTIVVHHISADGWSLGPLARDVMVAYAARTEWESPGWVPLAVQYADYTLWQRATLGSEDDAHSLISQQVEYWKNALRGVPDQLDLPTDRQRPARQSFVGGTVGFEIEPRIHRGLLDLGRERNASLFMVVHAALAVLLARLSGTDDIVIGTPVAGRGEQALDDVVGMFVNTLVLRTEVDGHESFNEQLALAREAALGAFAHSDIPFERLVEVLNPARSTARHPLFQVMLSFENLGPTHLDLPALSIDSVDLDVAVAKFDLQLTLTEQLTGSGHADGLAAEFTYATDLFDESTVRAFADRFLQILDAVIEDSSVPVGDIELYDAVERGLILKSWNNTAHDLDSSATVLDAFDAQVAAQPDAVAVVFDGVSITYAELDARVNRLGRYLVTLGAGPEVSVAVAMRRSLDMIVALYAVLRSGAAYVPVDPDQPLERNDYILSVAVPVAVLTTAHENFAAPSGADVVAVDRIELGGFSAEAFTASDRRAPLRGDNLAYVIFTSGSTGRPKGVAVSHAAVVNQVSWLVAEYGLDSSDVVLQKTPFTFDVSVWELFGALACGARLVVAEPDGHRDPGYLVSVIESQGVTATSFVPSMLSAFVSSVGAGGCACLRSVLVAGEALPVSVVESAAAALPGAVIHNLYGPTEFAVHATARPVAGVDGWSVTGVSVPMGTPVWNARVLVLDSRLRPVPIGVAGELYLSGAQVARGYFGRADLSADRFVASLFDDGARMYRTGDLVRWTAAGELEYLGRTDFQVKLRGLRIELGEIESALNGHDSIAQAVVLVRSEQLVAYVVPATGTAIDTGALQSAVGRGLPSYMIPSAFVVLGALPVGASGKLDRAALPDPVFESKEFRAPRTPVEEIVAGVFAQVLDVPRVGLDDDFFELGGNSLVATQVVSRVGAALGARVPVRVLFEASTVEALASRAESHIGGGRVPLVAGTRPDRIPLSLAQQRMWFLNRFDTESAANNLPVAIRLYGALDVSALQAAIADLLERHESLRTVYPESDGVAAQVILPTNAAVPVLTPVSVTESELPARIVSVMSRGFDVTTEVPLHAELFAISDQDFVLVFVAHHISADGWSMGPLTRDVMLAYASRTVGEAPGWPPLPVQYADYTLWQREVLGDENDPASLISTQAAFWKKELAGLPEELVLPFDRPRPAVQSFEGGTSRFRIDAELHRDLVAMARRTGTTLFMVVHSALAVLLARLSGTSDIAIGTPIAGRGEAELDDVIGMFVNTLVLRSDVESSRSFVELLDANRESDLKAFGHADIPFERLVEILNPERSTARHPLFQVALSFQNLPETSFELPGLKISAVDFDVDVAKFDLSLLLSEHTDDTGAQTGISAEFTYASALFDEDTVEVFARRFVRILRAAVSTPQRPVGDLPILGDEEYDWLTHVHGDAVTHGGTLPEIFGRGVAINPDGVAVRADGRSITYRELDTASTRLARALIARGAGPDSIVALAFPRSYEMVLSVWAVAKSGAAHLPVDPSYPVGRVEHMLADSGAILGITSTEYVHALPATTDWMSIDTTEFAAMVGAQSEAPVTDSDRTSPLAIDHAAYMIYTSGSTGLPKGVVVTHSGLGGVLDAATDLYHLDATSRFLHICSPSFDPSVLEWMAAFSEGATLVVVPSRIIGGDDLADLLKAEQVSHTIITPAVLGTMDPSGIDSLKVASVGGDVTTPDLLARWSAGRKYFNGYGPTETTIISTFAELRPGMPITVGRPIHGMSALVLDNRLNPVPVGAAGELYLAGGALARGYHAREDLTSSRFVANPYGAPGARMYRTGDIVRWTFGSDAVLTDPSTVNIEFVGRSDFQIKVRGFRVELGEIDAALVQHPDVSFAATLGRELPNGTTGLVSYVLPARNSTVDTAELASFVARMLPSHMVPSSIIVLDSVPLTPVGKLDRAALPEPVFEQQEFRGASNEIESIIAEVFADVLNIERVSVDESFFALGGDSIVSIQLVSRARARGISFTPRDVFERKSVVGLAEVATVLGETLERPTVEELPGGGVGPLALTPIMRSIVEGPGGFGRFAQSVAVVLPTGIEHGLLTRTLAAVVDHHDVLRSVVERAAGGEWTFRVRESGTVDIDALLVRVTSDPSIDDAALRARAEEALDSAKGRLDPESGRMLEAVWFDFDDNGGAPRPGILLVVAHHFVVDGVSWRILLPDLAIAWGQGAAEQAIALAPVGTSMRRWAHGLVDAAHERTREAEVTLWTEILAGADPLLGARAFDPRVDTLSTTDRVDVELSESVTEAVLTRVPGSFNGGVNDGLLAALALALTKWRARRGTEFAEVLIKLEGHGREEDMVPGADLSRTVGWFTSAFPVRLDLNGIDVRDAFAGGPAMGSAVKAVKEQLLAIPDKGMGFGLLRYLNGETGKILESAASQPQVSFNYLGRVSTEGISEELTGGAWLPSKILADVGAPGDPDMPANAGVDINSAVVDTVDGPRLTASLTFPQGFLSREDVAELADLWSEALTALTEHVVGGDAGGLTPSDVPLVSVSQNDIDTWEANFERVAQSRLSDIWSLAPLQSGLLFHALISADSVDVYTMRVLLKLSGIVDHDRLRAAAQALLDRYENLRTAFVQNADGTSVQIVLERVDVPWREVDLSDRTVDEREAAFDELRIRDKAEHFDLTAAPLMRFTLVKMSESEHRFLVSSHHLLLDGWSTPLLMRDLLALYALRGDAAALPRVRSYRAFLAWVAEQDAEASKQKWIDTLAGVEEPTMLSSVDQNRAVSAVAAKIELDLSTQLTASLQSVGARLGVTLNTMVQAAWGLLLGRSVGSEDVVFGATVSGRPAGLAGVESMVGLFINTLPVRVRYDGHESIESMLLRLQGEQAYLLEHHHVGLNEIQRAANLGALFDTLTVFESYPVDQAGLAEQAKNIDGMSVADVALEDATLYPLTLIIAADTRVHLQLKYLTDVFAATDVAAMMDRLGRILEAFASDQSVPVGDIDLSGPGERALVAGVNDTGFEVDGSATLVSLFAAQVAATPDAV
ncbi:MAG: amino acid adenylation domain-containing protein, partial [Rhodococcus sp. (in: high G+C Gram-positive bacteria)]